MGTAKKYSYQLIVLLLACLSFFFIYYHPTGSNPFINAHQQSYAAWLMNPVLQLLVCLSVSFMFYAINRVSDTIAKPVKQGSTGVESTFTARKTRILASVILLIIGLVILFGHWHYIHANFVLFITALLYYTYNPNSTHQSYYVWRYSLSPAKLAFVVVLAPLIMVLFYKYIKLKQLSKTKSS